MPAQYDIAIIGAGFAGLGAADFIVQQNQLRAATGAAPLKFVVLEKQNGHLGGRTETDADFFDLGAGYIGGAQYYMQSMIDRFSLNTFQTYLPNDKSWLYQDRRGGLQYFPGNNPLAMPGGQDTDILLLLLDQLALGVSANIQDITKWPQAVMYDGITAQQWIDQMQAAWPTVVNNPAHPLPQDSYDAFVIAVRSAFSVEPKELSMLFLLYYSACAGSFSALVDVTGGAGAAEGTRLSYGTADLANNLINQSIGASNIQFQKVTAIDQATDPTVVTITTDKGPITAKTVIVAMSPSASIEGITYNPVLTPTRLDLCKKMFMGQTIKGFMKYKSPFWRTLQPNGMPTFPGMMGYTLIGNYAADGSTPWTTYPLDWVMDNCWEPVILPQGPMPDAPFSVMTFIVGDSARYWGTKPAAVRAQAVLEHLVYLFGDIARTEMLGGPTDPTLSYTDADWKDRASKGCPTGILGTGTMGLLGELKKPFNRIFWAGSESANSWSGYMNGALQSGVRAVSQAISNYGL